MVNSVGCRTDFDCAKHSNPVERKMSLPDVSRWLPWKVGLGTIRQPFNGRSPRFKHETLPSATVPKQKKQKKEGRCVAGL